VGECPPQQLTQASAPLGISPPEATAFDRIRYATRIGGIERAAETIVPRFPVLRAGELGRVLKAENESAIAQRLGFVPEARGAKSWLQWFTIGFRTNW
jgi:hypothetical protein